MDRGMYITDGVVVAWQADVLIEYPLIEYPKIVDLEAPHE